MNTNTWCRNYKQFLTALAAVLLAAYQSAANQETGKGGAASGHEPIQVTINHNDSDEANRDFKFQTVPSPSKIDAATTAKFIIVDGETDPNSGGLFTLHDGQVPTEADQPSANFFFNAGTDGGRLLVDLGKVVEVKEVNTYSWHPSTRGAQVYGLYASDGSADNFNPRPERGTDPKGCGWKLVASVEARSTNDHGGGQYGVSISNPDGIIGKYHYLLFSMSDTEEEDNFGNTFYSEIDVVDANAPALGEAAASPAISYSPFVIKTDDGKCEITIDTRRAPELRDWADTKLAPALAEWYPKIVALLPSKGFTPPKHYTVTLRPGRGVAATSGTRVTGNSTWLQREIGGQAIGALVHETVHVVQQYGWRRRHNSHPTRSPGWLVEGMADYIRWFLYEPQSHGADIIWMRRRRHFSPRYNEGYRLTANFLDWVTQHYDKNIVTQLNAAMRNGNYQDNLWKKYTGKTVQELGDEWKNEIEAQLAIKPDHDASKKDVQPQ